MNRKKLIWLGGAFIAASLILAIISMFAGRAVEREPLPEEIAEYMPYSTGHTKAELLEKCTLTGEEEIGSNRYSMYESNGVESLLYRAASMERIAVEPESGDLFLQYADTQERSVTLGLDDSGVKEMAVYDKETDILFYWTPEQTQVWEHFSSGALWR